MKCCLGRVGLDSPGYLGSPGGVGGLVCLSSLNGPISPICLSCPICLSSPSGLSSLSCPTSPVSLARFSLSCCIPWIIGLKRKSRRRPTLARASPALPSAMEHLTSVFGMGTGVTTPLWPPAKNLCSNWELKRNTTFGEMNEVGTLYLEK